MSDNDTSTDLSTNLELLHLDDDMPMRIARSVPVDEDVLRLLANVNKTNNRMNTLVEREIQTDKYYSQEVGEIQCFVEGTRIPCGV